MSKFEKSPKDKDSGRKEGSKADRRDDKAERRQAPPKNESGRMAAKRGKGC